MKSYHNVFEATYPHDPEKALRMKREADERIAARENILPPPTPFPNQ